MRVVFAPPKKPRRKWAGLCFLVLIAAGWLLALVVTGDIAAVEPAPFRAIEQGTWIEATPSLLYNLLLASFCGIGTAFNGFAGGVLVFCLAQLLACAFAFARACFWLYAKGARLWLALIFAVGFAALFPFARMVIQPHPGALIVVCLLLLTLGLIDAVADSCARMRRVVPVCVLLCLLAALLFFDLAMLAVVVPTLVVLSFTPSRVKGRLTVFSLIMLALCLAALLVAFPYFGWSGDPVVYLRESITPSVNVAYVLPLAVTVAVLVGVLLNRRLRYLLPFVPLLAFGALGLFLSPQHGLGLGLSYGAFAFCLPFLILVPVIREYRETKETLRERFSEKRAAIAELERDVRAEVACATLLAEMTERLGPDDGYIGLYVARGGELPLHSLALQLSALGYRTAYPILTSETKMDFFTTLGVSDEALFNTLFDSDPFGVTGRAQRLIAGGTGDAGGTGAWLDAPGADGVSGVFAAGLVRVEPVDIAALVVPGIAFDRDRYRLGRGRGLYDRYILRLDARVPVWGIGFHEQLAEVLPVEDHDEPLDGLVLA
jgi:5-formyltetrahydrofolate cyclo-ligase